MPSRSLIFRCWNWYACHCSMWIKEINDDDRTITYIFPVRQRWQRSQSPLTTTFICMIVKTSTKEMTMFDDDGGCGSLMMTPTSSMIMTILNILHPRNYRKNNHKVYCLAFAAENKRVPRKEQPTLTTYIYTTQHNNIVPHWLLYAWHHAPGVCCNASVAI